jgi:uncharacterized membrane protein YcaP (DUF421 family)
MDYQELLMTAGRAVLVYVVFLIIIRVLGKRTVGNITPFDFLVALMLGEIVDEIIYGDVNMVMGFTGVFVIAAVHWLNSWLGFKFPSFDRLTGGAPTTLVKDGQLQRDGMAQERMNEDEVWEALRLQAIDDLKEVKQACLETTGQISVIKQEWARELQKGDLPGAQAGQKATEA